MHGQDDAKWIRFWTQGPFRQHPRRLGRAGRAPQKGAVSICFFLGLFAFRSIRSDKTLEEFLPTAYKDHFLIDRLSGRGHHLLLWKCVKAQTWVHCHCPPHHEDTTCVCRTSERPPEASGAEAGKEMKTMGRNEKYSNIN